MSADILVRVDASARMGTGHAMRCLALAEACRDSGARVEMITASMPVALLRRWEAENVRTHHLEASAGSLVDADETACLQAKLNSKWIAADGYHFGSSYQERLKELGCQVMLFDDQGGASRYFADLIVNQNAYADGSLYKNLDSARLLLGLRYLMLRREFRAVARQQIRAVPERATNILVMLGGADPGNVTERIVAALQRLGTLPIKLFVVIGAANPHAASVTAAAHALSFPTEVICNPSNIPVLMARSDCAIAAAGSTAWELTFLGVPFLAVSIVGNQIAVAASLEQNGVAVDLGPAATLNPEHVAGKMAWLIEDHVVRAAMSRRARGLIDGQGPFRLLQALGVIPLRLQRAESSDVKMLWQWANEAAVRQASFSAEPIGWCDHQQWYQRQLADAGTIIWIAYGPDDEPIGQIRFRCQGLDRVTIGMSITASCRGKGYAGPLITAGLREATRAFPGRSAEALIKKENIASLRAFRSAGFRPEGELMVDGVDAVRVVWNALPQ